MSHSTADECTKLGDIAENPRTADGGLQAADHTAPLIRSIWPTPDKFDKTKS